MTAEFVEMNKILYPQHQPPHRHDPFDNPWWRESATITGGMVPISKSAGGVGYTLTSNAPATYSNALMVTGKT